MTHVLARFAMGLRRNGNATVMLVIHKKRGRGGLVRTLRAHPACTLASCQTRVLAGFGLSSIEPCMRGRAAGVQEKEALKKELKEAAARGDTSVVQVRRVR